MNPQVLEAFREDGKRLRSLRDRKSTRLNSSHSQISYAVSFDRKSTRLNSSHSQISYAVFCLKKKTGGPYERGPAPPRPLDAASQPRGCPDRTARRGPAPDATA